LLAKLASERLRAVLDVTPPRGIHCGAAGRGDQSSRRRTVPGTNRLRYEVAAQQSAMFLRDGQPFGALLHG